MTSKEAYAIGLELGQKLAELPATLRFALREPKPFLKRLERLFSGKKRDPTIIPRDPEVAFTVRQVDDFGRPFTEAYHRPQAAPPLGTSWLPTASGKWLVAAPREPLMYAPRVKGMGRPMSEQLEGWGF